MEYQDPMVLRARAQKLRAQELARIAGVLALKWTTLKERLWHAAARRPRPDSPATPNG